jgi:hypothetical protein
VEKTEVINIKNIKVERISIIKIEEKILFDKNNKHIHTKKLINVIKKSNESFEEK